MTLADIITLVIVAGVAFTLGAVTVSMCVIAGRETPKAGIPDALTFIPFDAKRGDSLVYQTTEKLSVDDMAHLKERLEATYTERDVGAILIDDSLKVVAVVRGDDR